jgi:hypothetical protein
MDHNSHLAGVGMRVVAKRERANSRLRNGTTSSLAYDRVNVQVYQETQGSPCPLNRPCWLAAADAPQGLPLRQFPQSQRSHENNGPRDVMHFREVGAAVRGLCLCGLVSGGRAHPH